MTIHAARGVQRAFSRAAASYDQAADIQRQVVNLLIDRLPENPFATIGTARKPRIIDIGCGTGFAFSALNARFPNADLIGVDFSEGMLRQVSRRQNLQKIGGNATFLPFTNACADLVISSMTYQWCALDQALGEAHRVLRPGAYVVFSTLTGDTFCELRHAFSGIDDAPHVLPLLSPETIATTLADAGFVAAEFYRAPCIARFTNSRALFASIRQTGASEVSPESPEQTGSAGRRRGLLGKAAYATITSRLQALADAQGLVPLTYDVLYILAKRPGELA